MIFESWLKATTGASLSKKMNLNQQDFWKGYAGSKDNWKKEKVGLDTTKSSVIQKRLRLRGIKAIFGTTAHCELSRSTAANDYVWKEETRVEGTQFEFEKYQCNETTQNIGRKYGTPPKSEIMTTYHTMLEFRITGPCEQSVLTTHNLLLWNDLVWSSGARLALENLDELGKKPELTLTLKIPEANSSVVMTVKSILSLMNFVEVSTSDTCLDGLIVTQSLWKSRDQALYLKQLRSGSPVTSIHHAGTRDWTYSRT